ncbi:hypothetical protein GJ688_03810 [Heliobacillus mobilis]|uniref:Uncharacterized protein n=1 Tax=Heliobacterium mobile TaxID=28064 RepID=A0A6I3SH84_HELMO|nr:hypothetical protein [Heliobacterium mobile]MTV48107.1 hypothetical protein [Heliobacterium mobile]
MYRKELFYMILEGDDTIDDGLQKMNAELTQGDVKKVVFHRVKNMGKKRYAVEAIHEIAEKPDDKAYVMGIQEGYSYFSSTSNVVYTAYI